MSVEICHFEYNTFLLENSLKTSCSKSFLSCFYF
nr:MAG TPA: hypothetical protein [Caudoviricetes sp.]